MVAGNGEVQSVMENLATVLKIDASENVVREL